MLCRRWTILQEVNNVFHGQGGEPMRRHDSLCHVINIFLQLCRFPPLTHQLPPTSIIHRGRSEVNNTCRR